MFFTARKIRAATNVSSSVAFLLLAMSARIFSMVVGFGYIPTSSHPPYVALL
jgi:hypothetical protein